MDPQLRDVTRDPGGFTSLLHHPQCWLQHRLLERWLSSSGHHILIGQHPGEEGHLFFLWFSLRREEDLPKGPPACFLASSQNQASQLSLNVPFVKRQRCPWTTQVHLRLRVRSAHPEARDHGGEGRYQNKTGLLLRKRKKAWMLSPRGSELRGKTQL